MRLRDAACEYAFNGWHVLPLVPRGKRPATVHGKDDATTDLAAVLRLWEARDYNIGVCADASGLIVLDIDPRNGGDDTLASLVRDLGPLTPTLEAFTGGGGQHIIFSNPGGLVRGTLGPGIDIKDRGYIVVPPSIHPNGRRYEWSVDGHPDELSVAALPEQWLRRVERPSAPSQRLSEAVLASEDPLRAVPAARYISVLTGRSNQGGWFTCPFHKDGRERTPSLKVDGPLWSCFGACEPLPDQQVAGGNIYTFAGLQWGYAMPLSGADFGEVRERLKSVL